jgi:hypothetical protein
MVCHPLIRHVMDLMLNICEGHVFVELNYPHLIDIGGMNGITLWRDSVSRQAKLGLAPIVPNLFSKLA